MSGTFCEELALRVLRIKGTGVLRTKGTGHFFSRLILNTYHSSGATHEPMIACLPISIDLLSLRQYVQEKLCEIGMLEIDQFPMTERKVIKSGQTCGVYFCLHGPRSVKLTAIADFESKSLICYGSDGTRSVEQRLPR